jgi:RNA polymerase sigma factor (sigma-70 family)
MPAQVLKLLSAAAPPDPDAELLGRFAASRDETAFAELVRRHGPAVYRVCRRLVGRSSADDAFQATFLVLACRAGSVRKAASVGSWLIGVAGRVARQMRKRDYIARGLPRVPEQDPGQAPGYIPTEAAELAAILDAELARLPDSLRDPVVLCLVEGRTQEEAAAAVGGSVRTLRRRLDRAKALLRVRLERRGVVPAVAAGLVAGVGGSAAAVPAELIEKAVAGVVEFLAGGGAATPAAAVAKGVVMGTAKLKASALMATVAAVAVGLGVGWADDGRQKPPPTVRLAEVPDGPPPEAGRPAAPNLPLRADGTIDRNIIEVHFRTPNFIVYAPTAVMARAVAHEAEYQRKEAATKWLGKELPDWSEPHPIRVSITPSGTGGASSFEFGKKDGKPAVTRGETELRGTLDAVLASALPHEITHVVLAHHFGKPLPRWADEGIAILAEADDEQFNHDVRCRELLAAGRGIRLRVLFRMTDYPRDLMALYTQGHSVVRFLTRSDPAFPARVEGQEGQTSPVQRHSAGALQRFLSMGMDGNREATWNEAAKEVYGFTSVDAMEAAWLEWLKEPESRVKVRPRPARPARPEPRDAKPDLIPPIVLPGAAPPATPASDPLTIPPPNIPPTAKQ